ncbi:MAG: magnesium chelatase [Paenibacillaceae bacterium]|jgi:MoxR-like ATPase|nr:magnesium chelatase [Paenibacillaceae bacterium]
MAKTVSENRVIADKLRANLEACLLGKGEEIQLLLTALLAGGHVLLEDVPGTGKTVLIKALAKSIEGQYRRIQCNPDLLPTDITGVSIYHPKHESFLFRPGPVMTNILLADEINRATTKTQAALLEAMEERHVTVDGENYELPRPFLLLATQNPVEFEGTYSLPEAQLDRFMMKFSLGYPDASTESRMVYAQSKVHPLDQLKPVARAEQILKLQQEVREVHLAQKVCDYAVALVRCTREDAGVFLGAGPRATLALVQASKAWALLQGRDYVLPDDIKKLVPYVLGHRILLRGEARMEGTDTASLLHDIMQRIPAPLRLE